MRRIAVLVPGWLGADEQDSVLVRAGESLTTWAQAASVRSVLQTTEQPTASPEAAWLGLDPARYSVEPGPLAAACFGARPPWGATCFHVSLLGTDGDSVWDALNLEDHEAAELIGAARVLDTAETLLLEGEGPDHAWATRWPPPECDLVWASRLREVGYRQATADLERRLRRWIEDSVDLLQDHDVNKRRMDRGLPPANLLWPWGPGSVRAYEPWSSEPSTVPWVASGSIRVHGLAQLARMGRKPRAWFRNRSEPPFETLAEDAFQARRLIVHLADFRRARAAEDRERLGWLQLQFEARFLRPVMDQARKLPTRLLLAAWGERGALVGIADSEQPRTGDVPFDERALGEPLQPSHSLQEEIRRFFLEEAD
ncbi:MAG: hypothetical protein N2109_00185 [Fimbriimonadales bacterium]|nr:hypothetical protein [Fimbriimonadales bacterium]